MPPKKQKNPEDLVQPSIIVEGDKEHALRVLFKEDDAPILKSVGYCKIPGLISNGGTYVSYIVTSQGDKVLGIEVEQPNLIGIAEESAKMAFANTFMGVDE